jgi:choline dehydrogenase-like flavoprotein
MGTDRLTSVTDAYGFMHDVDRLLISDASVFPTPCRVNPMETIMSLATRSAAYVIDNSRRLLS